MFSGNAGWYNVHTTAEIRASFNAQFQSRVISCTAKVMGLPYSPNLPYFWSDAMIHLHQNKAQRPTMRPQAFLGISSYRDERDARRKSEYSNSHL